MGTNFLIRSVLHGKRIVISTLLVSGSRRFVRYMIARYELTRPITKDGMHQFSTLMNYHSEGLVHKVSVVVSVMISKDLICNVIIQSARNTPYVLIQSLQALCCPSPLSIAPQPFLFSPPPLSSLSSCPRSNPSISIFLSSASFGDELKLALWPGSPCWHRNAPHLAAPSSCPSSLAKFPHALQYFLQG